VSRFECTGQTLDIELIVDINTQLYPLNVGERHAAFPFLSLVLFLFLSSSRPLALVLFLSLFLFLSSSLALALVLFLSSSAYLPFPSHFPFNL
jgi:hypothetical protein